MATTSVDVSLVTDAVLAALRAHFEPKGIQVGDHAAPLPVNSNDVPGRKRAYVVVYRVPVGSPNRNEGMTGRTDSMKWVRHQFTAAASDRQVADRTAQEAVGLLLGQEPDGTWTIPLPVAGHNIMLRRDDGQLPVDTAGSVQAGGYIRMLVGLS